MEPKEIQKNKNMIESLLNMENEDKNIKIKILNLFIKSKIKEIFKNYLKDKHLIEYNGAKWNLYEFKTFADDLNEYSISKEEIKKIFEFLINDNSINIRHNLNNQKKCEIIQNIESSKEFNNIKNENNLAQLKNFDNEINSNLINDFSKNERKSESLYSIRRKITKYGIKGLFFIYDEYNKLYEFEREEKILYNKNQKGGFYEEKLNKLFKELNTIKKYDKFLKEKLPKFQIKSQIGKTVKELENFFDKPLEDVLKYSLPKNINDKDKDKYIERISVRILFAKEIEKEIEKNEENRLFNIYLKIKVRDYLKSFINDMKIIKYNEIFTQKIIYIKSFKTYNDFAYNDFSEKQKKSKEKYRKDFKRLLNDEIKSRKGSELRNLNLKNNENLKKKEKEKRPKTMKWHPKIKLIHMILILSEK